jgi:hypothetical protein
MTPELAQLLDDLPADVGDRIRPLLAEIDAMICKSQFHFAEMIQKSEDAHTERMRQLAADTAALREELFEVALERLAPQGNA